MVRDTESGQGAGSVGSQNAALFMGGGDSEQVSYYLRHLMINLTPGTDNTPGDTAASSCFESYDGTSFTALTNLPQPRMNLSAFGASNDAVIAGGNQGGSPYAANICDTTFTWDGSAWSSATNRANKITYSRPSTNGSSNAGIIAGGIGVDQTSPYALFGELAAPNSQCTEHYDVSLTNTLVSKELVAKDGIISASNLANGSISQSIASTGSFGLGKFTSVHTDANISASLASTASFGRVRAQGTISGGEFVGDGTGLTGVTAALFDGDNKLSGSLTSTGSFGRVKAAGMVEAEKFKGDGSNLTNVATSNTIIITGSLGVQSTEPITIPLLTADTAINTLRPGSLWINRTTGALNFSYLSSSIGDRAWSVGGTVGDSQVQRTAAGSQNAAILFNGYCSLLGGSNNTSANNACINEDVKCYDGTAWSASPNSTNSEIVGRGGAGAQNAAIAFGGIQYEGPSNAYDGNKTCSEEYDGTSWSEGNDMTCNRSAWASAGTQNSLIAFNGGQFRSSNVFRYWTKYNNAPYTGYGQNETIGYDGTTWLNCNDTVVSMLARAGCGTAGAAVAAGGAGGSNLGTNCITCVEDWDGTSWASGEALTTGRQWLAGAGTQNDGLVFGGVTNSQYSNSYCDDTEIYDGTNWSTGANLTTARLTPAGAGTSTSAFMVGSWEWECGATHACCMEEYSEGSLDTTLVRTMSGSAYVY